VERAVEEGELSEAGAAALGELKEGARGGYDLTGAFGIEFDTVLELLPLLLLTMVTLLSRWLVLLVVLTLLLLVTTLLLMALLAL